MTVSAWKLPYDPDYVSRKLHLVRRGLVKYIFQNKTQQNLYPYSKEEYAFKLHPEIEDLNTRVMYESDCDKVKLQFARNKVIGWDGSKALVTMDP